MAKLLILVAIDYVCGSIISIRDGTFKYQEGIKGLLLKVVEVLVCVACYAYENALGASVASLFALNEIMSILNNARKIGLIKKGER